MSFRGVSVKKMAKDIGEGYIIINPGNLRKYKPHELKQMLTALAVVQREVRAEHVEEEDYQAIKKKNWRIQNISRATLIINTFIKHRRIKI